MVRGSSCLLLAAVLTAGVILVSGGCQSTSTPTSSPLKGLAAPLRARADAEGQRKAVEADRFPTAKQAGI